MKHKKGFGISIVVAVLIAGCGKFDYKKTKGGLLYKIISTKDSKGEVGKNGSVLKFYFVQKLNDSILLTNYGKMPAYQPVAPNAMADDYDPSVVIPMLRKGDSAITVMLIDSLISKGKLQGMPPFAKRGDRISVSFKVVDMFPSDSLARKDYNAEMVRDRPRQEKEMKEQMVLQKKRMIEQRQQDEDEYRKSGEIDREMKQMKDYLASKKITAQQTGKGTFVVIKEPGSGALLADGDTVTVKYTGKRLANDSVFQSSTFSFPVGQAAVIEGWDEGIKLFKPGGKGTLYIPGFLAYGRNAGPPFKPFDPLIFDVEILNAKPATSGNRQN